MLLALIAAVAAAEPPSFDAPVVTAAKSKKDAAIVVSNQDYATLADATGAAADAAAFADVLLRTRGIPAERVTRAQDTRDDQLRTALAAAAHTVKKGGTLWIYWSGHGALAEDGQRVLLGVDAAADAPVGVPLKDVLAAAETSKAKQIVVLVDAGFGGVGRAGEALFPADGKLAPVGVAPSARTTVWLATTAAEPAYLYPANQRGLFSYFAIGALRGWADGQLGGSPDHAVTLLEAQGYVARVVRQIGGGDQRPGKDARADVGGWTLTQGWTLEAGPTKEDLAALALAEKSRRVKRAEGALREKATAEWTALSPTAAAPSPEAVSALTAFVARWDNATVTVDGAEVAVAVPEVAEARSRLDGFSRVERKGKKKKKKGAKVKPPPPPPVPTAACQDLLKLEPIAIAGELTPDLVQCIETRLAEEKLQTTRDKLSRILLIDADSRGDVAEWMRLADRHLEEVDRSDPDFCFKYALVISRGDIEEAESVLRWTSYALDNKHVWEGPTYMSRVYNLLRLRAETAARLWHEAEDDFLEERNDENMAAAEKFRGQAKDLAREWLDYARLSAQPIERPYALCQSAAGTAHACDAQ